MDNYLQKLIQLNDLEYDEMLNLMNLIMSGDLSSNYISAILAALSIKGETISEISAAAQVLRNNLTKVNIDDDIVDTCGTGGDGLKTFNVSTCASFVAAGANVKIAKHGGRSVSSSSGSADVLEKLGVNVSINHIQMEKLVKNIGIGFMFAPNFHPAMKNVAPIRKDLGVRTIFNVLGPLANPAGAKKQVIGVFKRSLTEIFAEVLKNLKADRVMIVHGEDGMDEISMSGKTFISELNNGIIDHYEIQPEDFNLERYDNKSLYAENVEESKEIIEKILRNEMIPSRNIILLNAGAIIYISGKTNSIGEAIELAKESIASGSAMTKLKNLVKESNE
jgi:anthranilate phosphoribosyltransferase